MIDKIFIVVMQWERDGLTMYPLESFFTREEAEEYIKNGCSEWEIMEVRVPPIEPQILCKMILNHGVKYPACQDVLNGNECQACSSGKSPALERCSG
jgi:hypothetical protein